MKLLGLLDQLIMDIRVRFWEQNYLEKRLLP